MLVHVCNHTTPEERWEECMFKASPGNIITYSVTPKRAQTTTKNPLFLERTCVPRPPHSHPQPPRYPATPKCLQFKQLHGSCWSQADYNPVTSPSPWVAPSLSQWETVSQPQRESLPPPSTTYLSQVKLERKKSRM